MLDRIDLHVEVTPVAIEELSAMKEEESSAPIRERVIRAREAQERRFQGKPEIIANALMPSAVVREVCAIGAPGQLLLNKAMERLGLSARAYDRILKVARTIADLAGSEDIKVEHLAEAIQYRSLDRENWAG